VSTKISRLNLTLADHELFFLNPVPLTILLFFPGLALFVVEADPFVLVDLKTYSSPFDL
jgi:hypothetical protein